MKISKSVINDHLIYLVAGYFVNEDVPPGQLSGYDRCIPAIRDSAEEASELDTLQLALEYLITHTEIDCLEYSGPVYPYRNEQLRDIFAYVRNAIWPDRKIDPAQSQHVILVE